MSQTQAEPRPSLVPIITGFALAGLLVLGLGFWVANRPEPAGVPMLTLLTPGRDTTVAGALDLRFRVSAPLALQPTGWGLGPYHVHALVGATELMPGAADIRPQTANEYIWTLPPMARTAPVQLVWSRANHSRVPQGASAIRQVTVQ